MRGPNSFFGIDMHACIFSLVNYWQGVKGGMEIHGKLLIEGLIKSGHAVTIISTNHPNDKMFERVEGAQIYYLNNTVFSSYWNNWGRESFRKFSELHAINPFNLIISQSFSAYYYAKRKSASHLPPLVSFIHGAGPNIALNQAKAAFTYKNTPITKILRIASSFFCHYFFLHLPTLLGSDAIICASIHVSQLVAKWYPVKHGKVFTVPNGIDVSSISQKNETYSNLRRHFGVKNDDILLMTSGSLTIEKGHHIAINALNLLLKETPSISIKLLIIGDGNYRDSLTKLVAKLGLTNRVFFTGFVPNELIWDYYDAADIYLIPTLRDEGLPFALLEAMATSLPIIASRIGGIPTVIEHGVEGLLIEPGDLNGIVSAISSLLKDKNLGHQIGSRARSKVFSDLNSEIMVDKSLRIINSILGKGGN